MSSFYIDTTESRVTSRLPKGVIQAADIVSGLEEFTGADMLLSPLNAPQLPVKITDILPHQSALKTHCRAGMLVQRKHGLDLIHSIPDLKVSLFKMQQYTQRPYLLFIGVLSHEDGIATVDGKVSAQRTSYMNVILALEKWQQRGGFYVNLSAENWIAPWINLWLNRLIDMPQEKIVRPAYQRLMGPMEKNLHRETLMTLPRIGEKLAQDIVRYAGPLKNCIDLVTNPGTLDLKHRPKGLGPKTIERCRERFGLEEGEIIVTIYES